MGIGRVGLLWRALSEYVVQICDKTVGFAPQTPHKRLVYAASEKEIRVR